MHSLLLGTVFSLLPHKMFSVFVHFSFLFRRPPLRITAPFKKHEGIFISLRNTNLLFYRHLEIVSVSSASY